MRHQTSLTQGCEYPTCSTTGLLLSRCSRNFTRRTCTHTQNIGTYTHVILSMAVLHTYTKHWHIHTCNTEHGGGYCTHTQNISTYTHVILSMGVLHTYTKHWHIYTCHTEHGVATALIHKTLANIHMSYWAWGYCTHTQNIGDKSTCKITAQITAHTYTQCRES